MSPQRLARFDIQRLELTEVSVRRRMLVVSPTYRARTATTDPSLRGTERALLAAQAERQIHRTRLRTVGHRAPALETGGAWAPVDLDAHLWNFPGLVRHGACLGIHVDERLISDVGGANECARHAIELPENSKLAHL